MSKQFSVPYPTPFSLSTFHFLMSIGNLFWVLFFSPHTTFCINVQSKLTIKKENHKRSYWGVWMMARLSSLTWPSLIGLCAHGVIKMATGTTTQQTGQSLTKPPFVVWWSQSLCDKHYKGEFAHEVKITANPMIQRFLILLDCSMFSLALT